MWQDDDEIARLLGTLGPVTKYQKPGVNVPFDNVAPSLRDRTVPSAPYTPEPQRIAPNSVFDSVVDVPSLPQPSGFALANKFNQSQMQQNPIGSMSSSADMDAARRQQAQAAWNQGAGAGQWQPPLNSMMPGNYVPPPSSGTPQPASMYSDFVGPQYDRNAQQAMAGPRMDSSVNGLLPAAEWSQSGGGFGGPSPYAALDNFMSRDPVHILGVNGFRTGASRPSVDYSGPMQRQQAIRNNMDMEAMLGRQDIARNANNLDAMRFSLASQDRQDAIRQRSLRDFEMSYGKTPVGSRGSLVDAYSSVLPPPVANKLALEDIIGGAIIDAGHLDSDKRPKSMEGFARSIGKRFDPSRHDVNGLMQQLTGMGITRDDIEKMRGKPGMEWINRLDTNQLPAAPESFLKWFMKPMM